MIIILCESCATVDAIAPLFSPKPFTKPFPILPVALCLSKTVIFNMSFSTSASAKPLITLIFAFVDFVSNESGIISIALTVSDFAGILKSSCSIHLTLTEPLRVGVSLCSILTVNFPSFATICPSLNTISGLKSSRLSNTSRFAL